MSKTLKKKIALVCVACLTFALLYGFSPAKATETDKQEQTENDAELIIEYTEIPVYLDDVLLGDGLKFEESTYVPLRAFCEAINPDAVTNWDDETSTVTVNLVEKIPGEEEETFIPGEQLTLVLCLEDRYMTANGRYLYLEDGAYCIGGITVVPVRELCRAFGLEVEWDEDEKIINISTEDIDYIDRAEEFYDEDDVYWLSRLINSEAGNQPLEGKIGVGNVVLNRIEKDTCPDNIYDVIFDIRYGVQFSVIETGGIFLDPNEESIIAAMLCLEGYNTVDDSIYFLNPEISSSKWFEENSEFMIRIGDHDFYA